MVKLDGQLVVKTINGRNGPFNVGKLFTDVGEFAVKSARLEEMEEGQFPGVFLINKIFPSCYTHGGRIVAEIRADVAEFLFREVALTATAAPELPAEPDPLDEEATPVANAEHPSAATALKPTEPDAADPAELFGEIWPIGQQVRLDATVPRAVLRAQTTHLKAHGYRYAPSEQIWTKQN